MFKKKLLILIGAGASVELDIPSVSQLNTLLDRSIIRTQLSQHGQSLYRVLRNQISSGTSSSTSATGNFEDVLYSLFVLDSLSSPHSIHPAKGLVSVNSLGPVLDKFEQRYRRLTHNDYRFLAAEIVDTVLSAVRHRSFRTAKRKPTETALIGGFWRTVSTLYDLGIASTNYDDVPLQFLPRLFTGFDPKSGTFDKIKTLRQHSWNFIYHMHGSVHFDMTGCNSDMHAISWRSDLTGQFSQNSRGRSAQYSGNRTPLPTSVIVAGYEKLEQLQREPFRTYYASLESRALEADGILTIGYGFSDNHINNVLRGVRQLRKVPALVISYQNCPNPFQFRSDKWATVVCKTLGFNPHSVSPEGHAAPMPIRELRKRKICEVSHAGSGNVAIWYDGFTSACRHFKRLKRSFLP